MYIDPRVKYLVRQLDHPRGRLRKKALVRLLKLCRRKYPVLFCGDFVLMRPEAYDSLVIQLQELEIQLQELETLSTGKGDECEQSVD